MRPRRAPSDCDGIGIRILSRSRLGSLSTLDDRATRADDDCRRRRTPTPFDAPSNAESAAPASPARRARAEMRAERASVRLRLRLLPPPLPGRARRRSLSPSLSVTRPSSHPHPGPMSRERDSDSLPPKLGEQSSTWNKKPTPSSKLRRTPARGGPRGKKIRNPKSKQVKMAPTLPLLLPFHIQRCRHRRDVPLSLALLYCGGVASLFVLSLYALVPPSVRALPRDHVRHVRWRSAVVSAVTAAGIGAYPWLFCLRGDATEGSTDESTESPPWYRYLGLVWQPAQDAKIALHVLTIYLGSLSCAWLKVYHNGRVLDERSGFRKKVGKSSRLADDPARPLPRLPGPKCLWKSFQYAWLRPTIHSFERVRDDEVHRWTKLRNLFVAPLAEEAIFRACLLPPLLASRSEGGGTPSPTQASWIAPLFFGFAHAHHFYERCRTLPPRRRTRKVVCQLLLGVAVQWTYTTLFGAYASHAFVRTGSLSAAVVAHVICNYLGLPEIGFLHPTSDLHRYRWLIAAFYFVGIWMFVVGFDSTLFPKESVLPSLLQ
ncbi:hypothetical protein ACHAWF_014441 [Thalassiosira exigua]